MNKQLPKVIFFILISFGTSAQSKLIFSYDTSGNQNQRFYCAAEPCNPPSPTTRVTAPSIKTEDAEKYNATENEFIENGSLRIFPNPTTDKVIISFNNSLTDYFNQLKVYNMYSTLIRQIKIEKNSSRIEFDLSDKSAGLYLFVFEKADGSTIIEKIIKY